jgi:signal transduction histidine kinase
MANLVDNALKYGKAGESVNVDLIAPGPGLCLVVGNAIGSAGAPDPQCVFEKYYRAPQAHSFTGSGLGLHISQALVRLLGGELRYVPDGDRALFELHL